VGPTGTAGLHAPVDDGSIGDMDEHTPAEATEARRKAVLEMEQLLHAASDLRDDLDGHIGVCKEIIEGLGREEDLGVVLDRVRSHEWRPKLTDALTTYERLRHRARLRLIALGVAEGMTVDDVERHWSITRQLANRSIRDAGQLD
jgi:hypothetical protein